MRKRVVVTGLGIVSPLGCNVSNVWKRIIQGESGIVSLRDQTSTSSRPYTELPSQVAGLVQPSQEMKDFLKKHPNAKRWSKFIEYAMFATHQALLDAKYFPKHSNVLERTGVAIGTGIGSLQDTLEAHATFESQGLRRLSPFFVPRILCNMAAGNVGVELGLKGPNHSVSTACTTGAHSIGDAMRFIQYGDADVMICGGTEASISPLSIAGFAKARSLSTKFNDTPQLASRPFDSSRDGFVIGEGAGILILESLEHALNRDAKIYAEIKGYGLSSDGWHITAPPEDGNGAVRSMKRALEVAELDSIQVDYVNAHATSTELGDLVETRAIKQVLGNNVTVSSTKGATGHLLGAAGAVESIFTVLAVHTNVVPPTNNLQQLDDEFTLDYVKNGVGRDCSTRLRRSSSGTGVHVALSNSFGFGGTNASLIFAKYRD